MRSLYSGHAMNMEYCKMLLCAGNLKYKNHHMELKLCYQLPNEIHLSIQQFLKYQHVTLKEYNTILTYPQSVHLSPVPFYLFSKSGCPSLELSIC